MKAKVFKSMLITGLITLSALTSIKIIKNSYKTLRVEFLNHARGQTQSFISYYIN